MTGPGPNLARRTASACVLVPGILALTWAGGWALFALVAAIVGRSSWEFYHLAADAGYRPPEIVGDTPEPRAVRLSSPRRSRPAGIGYDAGSCDRSRRSSAGRNGRVRGQRRRDHGRGSLHRAAGQRSAPDCRRPRSAARRRSRGSAGTDLRQPVDHRYRRLRRRDPVGQAQARSRNQPEQDGGRSCRRVGGRAAAGCCCSHSRRGFPHWELAGFFLVVAASAQIGDLVQSALKRDFGVKDAPRPHTRPRRFPRPLRFLFFLLSSRLGLPPPAAETVFTGGRLT